MDLDQCVQVIETLREAYKKTAQLPVNRQKYLKMKHMLTQVELNIISMRKSLKTMEENSNIKKATK